MFLGLALLNSGEFNKQALVKAMKKDWDMEFILDTEGETEEEKNVLYIEIDNIRLGVALFPVPVPNNESANRARRNVNWDDAIKVAKEHKAHLVVTSVGENKVESSKLFVKILASISSLDNVVAIDAAGTVFEPKFYAEMAKYSHEANALPLYNLICFGIYSSDKDTISAYTMGMAPFGKPEMEVIKSKHSMADVHQILLMLASHVIQNDIILQDKDEIKLTETESIIVERSKGVALNAETIKIKY